MKQNGITLFGFVLILSLVSMAALITMRIVPLYYEHYSIKTAFTSLKSLALKGQSDAPLVKLQIREALRKRFDMNNIASIKMKDIKIVLAKNGYKVSAKYQLQSHVISNIDVIMYFNDEVLVPYNVR